MMNLTMGIALFAFGLGLTMSVQRLITTTKRLKFEGSYAYSATDMWSAVIGMATSSAGLGVISTLLAVGG